MGKCVIIVDDRVIEGDSIILKKAYPRQVLEELVIREQAPLLESEMDSLIHEIRK